jgi:integrase
MAIQDFRLTDKKRTWRTKPLTETDIKTLSNGTYRDVRVPNLFLRVRGKSKTWIFRYMFNGKQRPLHLGSYKGIDLEKARDKARECNRLIGEDIDPAEKKNNEQADLEIAAGLATKMKEATHYYMNTNIAQSDSEDSKKNAKRYCKQIIETIGEVPVRLIDTSMILKRFNLVERYYASGQVPNGERLRFYLQAIFSLFSDTCKLPRNPAGWEAMRRHLGKFVQNYKANELESQPGVHLEDMGRFLYELQHYQVHKSHGHPNSTLWVELIYLTGSRPGEGRKATWGEIVNDDWIVPKHHLKKRRKARAQPITEPMHAVFDKMRQRYRDTHGGCEPSRDDLIFPKESGGLYAIQATSDVMKALKWDYRITAHGARNTIRNWFQKNGKDTSLLVIQFDHRPPESGAMKFYDASVRVQVEDPTLELRRRVMKEYCEWCMKELAAYRNRIEALPTDQQDLSCPIPS